MTSRHILFWFVLAAVAVLNGVIRVATYGRVLDEQVAHQLSTLIGIILSGAAFFMWIRRVPVRSASQALVVGCAWLTMTVSFEFVFGYFVAGHIWSRLLHDYDIFSGRVWLLFLAWILVLPYLGYRFGRSAN